MKKEGFYSSGTFAAMAHVTKKTLRYYDDLNILKPSYTAGNGNRYYTDNDFAKLQQILFLKYLSFPLADIKELTVRGADREFWLESLKMQTSLLEEHIEHLEVMKKSLHKAQEEIAEGKEVSWSDMIRLSNASEMEQKLKKQYVNSSNISARIHLHNEYSENQEGWFPWLYRIADIHSGDHVLELGCGDGSFWTRNIDKLPAGAKIVVSDNSDGIVRETAKAIRNIISDNSDGIVRETAKVIRNIDNSATSAEAIASVRPAEPIVTTASPADVVTTASPAEAIASAKFEFRVIDGHHIPAEDNTFQIVTANHMLFYCENLPQVLSEIRRVLVPGGKLVCSTYSASHMQEVNQLVRQFDDRIVLSADALYEKFGKENGQEILSGYFAEVQWQQFEDHLNITKPEPLIAYILSCHGNQNRYIVDKYHEFYSFVKKKTDKGFRITKDAGAFIAEKES